MSRFVIILLCVCIALGCIFAGYFGYVELTKSEDQGDAPTEITCEAMLGKVPADLKFITLTEFRPGKHFVAYDDDDDGQWERVFVPLFPATTRKLGQNYYAVIVRFDDVRNKQQLDERVKSPSIDVQYWRTSQQLDRRTYSRMARDYSSMNFRRNVILYSGSPSSNNLGRMIMICSGVGLLGSMLIGGWQASVLTIAGIKRQIKLDDDKDEEKQITNRAGLPTNHGNALAGESGKQEQPAPNSNQLMSEKYLRE